MVISTKRWLAYIKKKIKTTWVVCCLVPMKGKDRNKTSKKKEKKKKWNGTTTKQGTKFNGGVDTKKKIEQ